MKYSPTKIRGIKENRFPVIFYTSYPYDQIIVPNNNVLMVLNHHQIRKPAERPLEY